MQMYVCPDAGVPRRVVSKSLSLHIAFVLGWDCTFNPFEELLRTPNAEVAELSYRLMVR